MEWTKQTYNSQYEKWVPWAEDMYLRWFTKDNKASYATKRTYFLFAHVFFTQLLTCFLENLDKTKVTGISQVDTLQDGVNNIAAGQVGQGGLFQPVGDAVSKEGVNRAERQGKDDKGSYNSSIPGGDTVGSAVGGLSEGVKGGAGKVGDGLSGLTGMGKTQSPEEKK